MYSAYKLNKQGDYIQFFGIGLKTDFSSPVVSIEFSKFECSADILSVAL